MINAVHVCRKKKKACKILSITWEGVRGEWEVIVILLYETLVCPCLIGARLQTVLTSPRMREN